MEHVKEIVTLAVDTLLFISGLFVTIKIFTEIVSFATKYAALL